jgi:glycolate oxidase
VTVSSNELYDGLAAIVGIENVTNLDFDRYSYSRDLSPARERLASMIARPRSTSEVAAIMRFANRNRLPVYVRGAGASHWAAWLPVEGGLLLDMYAMEDVIEIDSNNLTATVQSGCTWYKLDRELRKKGLTYLSSEMGGPAMTVGGSVIKAGGGPYGATKFGTHGQCDVLGLEFVLPTGEIVRTGSRAYLGAPPFRRYGIGPDLTGLLIGSEGTLGILTEATLQVRPIPEAEDYASFTFDNWKDVMEVGDAITRQFGDEIAYGFQAGEESNALGAITATAHLYGYDKETLDYRSRKLKELCKKFNGKETDTNLSREYFGRVTSGLKGLFDQGVWHFAGAGMIPIRRLPEFSEAWREIVARNYKFPRCTFGAWTFPRGWTVYGHLRYADPGEHELIMTISDELNRRFTEMGIITFGIGGPDGMLPFIRGRLGSYYELLRSMKKALDPNGILQPGILVE